MNKNGKRHSFDSFFSFFLLLFFALSALFLAQTGAAVYRNGSSHLGENFSSRTAVAFVAEKIRQHDEAGGVSLTELEDIPAICLRESIDGDTFLTYLYYYEGALRELFIRETTAPSASAGNKIVELSSFTVEKISGEDQEETILRVTAVSPEQNALTVHIAVNCK